MIIGIDPGLTGALAFYDKLTDTFPAILDMPVTERKYGKGKEIDWKKLEYRIQETVDSVYGIFESDVICIMEDVGVMPKQGIVSAFQFGKVIGGLESMFDVLGIPMYKIHPKTWKAKMGLVGSDKNASLNLVRAVYPAYNLTLQKHHNRAEAMCIAVAGSNML